MLLLLEPIVLVNNDTHHIAIVWKRSRTEPSFDCYRYYNRFTNVSYQITVPTQYTCMVTLIASSDRPNENEKRWGYAIITIPPKEGTWE
jgi:hypothetical protein